MKWNWKDPPPRSVEEEDTTAGLLIFKRLLAQARPYWAHMGGILMLSLMATPVALLTPLPLKIAVDSVLHNRPLPQFLQALVPGQEAISDATTLWLIAGLVVVVAVLMGLQVASTFWLQFYVAERLVLRFQSDLFRHAQRLSLTRHDSKGTADSLYRIQYDAREIPNIIIMGVIPIIGAAATVIGMMYVTARIDLLLAVISLIVAPLLFYMLRSYGERSRKHWGEAKKLQSSAVSVIQETLGAIRVVKAFGQEERHSARFVDYFNKSIGAQVRVVLAEATFGLNVAVVLAVGTAFLLLLGVNHVQAGILTLGELLLVMGYLTQLYLPLQAISQRGARLQASLASADRAFALLDELPDVAERKGAKSIERAVGAIEFKNVTMSFNGLQNVLDDCSFKVAAGMSVGVAGPTGAGKTTLTNLMMRFMDPTSGEILLDGVDLRDYGVADLRKQFSVVLQDTILFVGTIGENIAYARPSANSEEVAAAARAANVYDFICALPQGFDSPVGERGMLLSGGERQRIALARAFLRDAPILILDEPTSAIDTGTEALIMDALKRLMEGRTTFMVAHRVSTLGDCHELLYVDNGKVKHVATSSELLRIKRSGETRTARQVRAKKASTRPRRQGRVPGEGKLAAGLASVLQVPRAFIEINDREPAQSSTYTSEIVSCTLSGRSNMRLFCKYSSGNTKTILRHQSHGHRRGISYEAEVYRKALGELNGSSPFCGLYESPSRPQHWLILRFVEGEPLNWLPRSDALNLAGRWLGTFHATNERQIRRGNLDFIPTYDSSYYHGWSARTLKFASPHLRDFAWLPELVRRFDDVIPLLTASHRTLVHGEFYGKNVVLQGRKVVVVDWESAAKGAGEIDLAALTEGWPEKEARSCVRSYKRRRWPEGPPAAFDAALAAARLYLCFRWLGDRAEWTAHPLAAERFESALALGEELSLL